jgi:hypothetical protein
VSEVPLDQMVALISTEQVDEVITPNMPSPLVAKVVKGGQKNITIELPPTRRHISIPMMEVDDYIWYPPVWFRVSMSAANVVSRGFIAVVPERSLNWEDTRLCKMSLPNVSSDGSICFGSAVATARIDERAPTEAETMQSAMTLFFDSNFNNHLLFSTGSYDRMVERSWGMCRHRETYEKKKGYKDNPGLMKLLACLTDENGWQGVQFEPLAYGYSYGMNTSGATTLPAKKFVGL